MKQIEVERKATAMRILPIVLLLVAVLGCGDRKGRSWRDHRTTGGTAMGESIYNAAKVIRKATKPPDEPIGKLTKADFVKVTTLVVQDKLITDLTPLEDLAKLEKLGLQNNLITDLTPLAGLTKLKELSLQDNRITDLTPLAGLTKLERLTLHENKITDLKPLAGLTNLEFLTLHKNQIDDLTPLVGMTKLKTLGINNNPNLTKAEIDKLKKALPKCKIFQNAKK